MRQIVGQRSIVLPEAIMLSDIFVDEGGMQKGLENVCRGQGQYAYLSNASFFLVVG